MILSGGGPIQLDPAVLVQVELGIIGAGLTWGMVFLWKIFNQMQIINGILQGPKGDQKDGLVKKVNDIVEHNLVSGELRLRTIAEYVSWRRRVEFHLARVDPTFQPTPEVILLNLVTGEHPV